MPQNTTDKIVIDMINEKLQRDFRVLDGRPIYRIVWSDDQIEKRIGNFTDWYGSILIRETYQAYREVKKYWYFKYPCWVLEKLIFIANHQALKEMREELIGCENGSYEPIFSFKDKDENPLPVSVGVVDFIIWKLHNPTKTVPSDIIDQMRLEEEEEKNYFFEKLSEDERSPLFVWENSAFVSTNQIKHRLEYKEKLRMIEKGTSGLILPNRIS